MYSNHPIIVCLWTNWKEKEKNDNVPKFAKHKVPISIGKDEHLLELDSFITKFFAKIIQKQYWFFFSAPSFHSHRNNRVLTAISKPHTAFLPYLDRWKFLHHATLIFSIYTDYKTPYPLPFANIDIF